MKKVQTKIWVLHKILQKTKHDAWIAFFKNHQNVSDNICLQIKNEIYLA